MKPVNQTERILVGWGTAGTRVCFFLWHKELPETKGNPIVCRPEDLQKKLLAMVHIIEGRRALLRKNQRAANDRKGKKVTH